MMDVRVRVKIDASFCMMNVRVRIDVNFFMIRVTSPQSQESSKVRARSRALDYFTKNV